MNIFKGLRNFFIGLDIVAGGAQAIVLLDHWKKRALEAEAELEEESIVNQILRRELDKLKHEQKGN